MILLVVLLLIDEWVDVSGRLRGGDGGARRSEVEVEAGAFILNAVLVQVARHSSLSSVAMYYVVVR